MKYIVLGGYGIIGKAVVDDLFHSNKNSEIIISGRDLKKAEDYTLTFKSNRVRARKIDINNEKQLVNLLKRTDVCVNCLQYEFNVQVMKACVKAKTNYLDLGGLVHETKKQLKLNNEFKKIGKIAILGCGGTPGITNVMAGYASKILSKINSIEITFADKDETKYNQSFVLPYSFKTLVDEYTLKPAVFKNGKIYFAKPYSGFKNYDFGKEFGKQKGFYTLHSELATFPDSFKNKGLKNCEFRVTFPQEFNEIIETLIELGFTSKKINFKNKEIKSLDITSKIMERNLPKPNTKIKDKELIRVIFNKDLIMDCITTSNNKYSAGVLDTAVPCSIIAQFFKDNFPSGVYPPEKIIPPEKFFKELKKRKIFVYKNGKIIN